MSLAIGIGPTFGGGGAAGTPVPALPQTGLISEWRFAEGSGNAVADSVGANPINLDLPTTPNYTWQTYGITLATGLVQTPAITSCRTMAFLYRVGRNSAAGGYQFSGGPGGNGAGMQDDFIQNTYTWHCGSGQGVAPLKAHTNGIGCRRINRGGWILVFCEFNAASSNPFGFGGRFNTTSNRQADFEIMWAAGWSGQLTTQNRSDAYDYVRNLAKLRGKPIDYRDCTTRYEGILLWGQSNAEGNTLISGLSAPDQARTTPNSVIMPAALSSPTYPEATMVLGINQQKTNPASLFGPEMGASWSHEDGSHPRKLGYSKTAAGSTWLVASSSGLTPGPAQTWNSGELVTGCLFWNAMQNWWDFEQHSLLNNIGPRLRALWFMQGEQDAKDATLVAPNAYQANLQALYDSVALHTGSALKVVIGRIRNQDPSGDPAAQAGVRAAQADFVAANPTVATLIDTDSFGLGGDSVHYSASGMKSLGQAFYAATDLS